jgi:hypothetical protein
MHISIYRLRNKHRELERQLRRELTTGAPNTLRVAELKRRKLALKNELFRLESGLAPLYAH